MSAWAVTVLIPVHHEQDGLTILFQRQPHCSSKRRLLKKIASMSPDRRVDIKWIGLGYISKAPKHNWHGFNLAMSLHNWLNFHAATSSKRFASGTLSGATGDGRRALERKSSPALIK